MHSNKICKKILRKISGLFFGRKILQRLFEFLHMISLKGMNFSFSEASGSSEGYTLKLIQQEKGGGTPIIFDVGANKGQYANIVNNIFKGKAKIYSFEPGKFTYSELVKNTSAVENIEINNFGLGAENTEMSLNYDEQGSGLASVYERKLGHKKIDFSKNEKVQIKKIDDFCKDNNINNIKLLKMDVEGHELEVLKGAGKMLRDNKIEAIQFEFGGCNIDSRTYFQDFYSLLNDKYIIYRILQNGLHEIKQYSELQEIFTTVNYFAKLR